MFIFSLYLIIGVAICAIQKEPESTGDESADAYYMYLLLFVFICWPVVLLWWLVRRLKV